MTFGIIARIRRFFNIGVIPDYCHLSVLERFDALNYMYNEAMKKNFDVAIIGYGAYGFPLVATQLLFGIIGRPGNFKI